MKIKTHKRKIVAFLLATTSIVLGPANVFANNHGITYNKTNAQELGISNVQEDTTLIDSLTPLIQSSQDAVSTEFAKPNSWQSGFIKDSVGIVKGCLPAKYFKVSSNNAVGANNDYSFTISNNDYRAEVSFNDVSIEPSAAFGNKSASVAIIPGMSWLYSGWLIYSDADCTVLDESVARISSDDTRLFANLHMKMYRRNSTTPLVSNKLYFGLYDIDAAQSYKILNADSTFSKNNMYTKSIADLQESGNPLKNWFVPAATDGGPYIFSEYNPNATGSDKKTVSSANAANIFVKLGEQTQSNGLDIVLGFANDAASGISYYAKQYKVNYQSDENGKIDSVNGITTEQVISGENPSGSIQAPNEGYVFTRWTADTNVTLKNGTTITKGNPITGDEIKQVVVNSDITFTAYHAKVFNVEYVSDENGTITGIIDETVEANNNPSGTDHISKNGYILSHWVADVDVLLEDGTTIKAGDPITSEQIKQVKVRQNIVFTAIHIPKVAIPETGDFTKDTDAAQIATISVFGIMICGLAIKFLPRILRKKVNFD